MAVTIVALLLAACDDGGGSAGFSSEAHLADLTLSAGELDQVFQSSLSDYTATVGFLAASTTVTPTLQDTNGRVTVNGIPVLSGNPSESISCDVGYSVIPIVVTAEDGVTTSTYTLTVTRQSVIELAQRAYIKASNTSVDDSFGGSIALSRGTLAVGAPGEDSAATGIDGNQTDNSADGAGATYAFTRDGNVWGQQAYIKASLTDGDGGFFLPQQRFTTEDMPSSVVLGDFNGDNVLDMAVANSNSDGVSV